MSDMREVLVAAIRETPDDDAPRLVMADWLEEQGSEADVARAEFIRTQIARANLPEADERQSALQARELRLLKRYGRAWCGSHFVFKKVLFRRGFIEYVHLHLQHFLHHRRQMLALEPVRDIRLTGFHRAPDDLIQRVAACSEWQQIERLRIHHQGPHKSPRSNLLLLLESPHFTRLRSLICPLVTFTNDARRRFERLPILRQIESLTFPDLDFYPDNPAPWFSDGVSDANQWLSLRELNLPIYLMRNSFFQAISQLAFWPLLTKLSLSLTHDTADKLSILNQRFPRNLQSFIIHIDTESAEPDGIDQFFDNLAQAPLKHLQMDNFPPKVIPFANLLSGANQWNLQSLSFNGYNQLTNKHLSAIANSPGVTQLHTLALSGATQDSNFSILFQSECLNNLVHLNLEGHQLGKSSIQAWAKGNGINRLRSLEVTNSDIDEYAIRQLIAASKFDYIICLSAGDMDRRNSDINMTEDFVNELLSLPQLAYLHLDLPQCDAKCRNLLENSETIAWKNIRCLDKYESEGHTWGSYTKQPPVELPLYRF